MLTVLPLAMGVESLQNMLGRIGRGHSLAKYDKWINISWLFVITPSVILLMIMGIVGRGNAGHFRSAHNVSILPMSPTRLPSVKGRRHAISPFADQLRKH